MREQAFCRAGLPASGSGSDCINRECGGERAGFLPRWPAGQREWRRLRGQRVGMRVQAFCRAGQQASGSGGVCINRECGDERAGFLPRWPAGQREWRRLRGQRVGMRVQAFCRAGQQASGSGGVCINRECGDERAGFLPRWPAGQREWRRLRGQRVGMRVQAFCRAGQQASGSGGVCINRECGDERAGFLPRWPAGQREWRRLRGQRVGT